MGKSGNQCAFHPSRRDYVTNGKNHLLFSRFRFCFGSLFRLSLTSKLFKTICQNPFKLVCWMLSRLCDWKKIKLLFVTFRGNKFLTIHRWTRRAFTLDQDTFSYYKNAIYHVHIPKQNKIANFDCQYINNLLPALPPLCPCMPTLSSSFVCEANSLQFRDAKKHLPAGKQCLCLKVTDFHFAKYVTYIFAKTLFYL